MLHGHYQDPHCTVDVQHHASGTQHSISAEPRKVHLCCDFSASRFFSARHHLQPSSKPASGPTLSLQKSASTQRISCQRSQYRKFAHPLQWFVNCLPKHQSILDTYRHGLTLKHVFVSRIPNKHVTMRIDRTKHDVTRYKFVAKLLKI